ncbi:MAG: hypothetical protein U0905_17835 [Pirellulales bacterium]
MNRSKAKRWLCMFGILIIVATAYTILVQNKDKKTTSEELRIVIGPEAVWTTGNGEQNIRHLGQSVDDLVEADKWQWTDSSLMTPYRTVASVLISGDGCKTFTYDGDGNLLLDRESQFDSVNYPFGESNR